MKTLLIVESPTKAKTIKKLLWYDTLATYWHIFELPEKKIWIDFNTFEPYYVFIKWKKKILDLILKKAKLYNNIYLATDNDREWELISYHLSKYINWKRIVFQEITKNALYQAIKNPKDINYNLVLAQKARRVLDRLVWYILSPYFIKHKIWRSVWRVQTVALRLIVERERELQKYEIQKEIYAIYKNKKFIYVSWNLINPITKEKEKVIDNVTKKKWVFKVNYYEFNPSLKLNIKKIEKKYLIKKTPKPLVTYSILKYINKIFKVSSKNWYKILQSLYENWTITYIRTDSYYINSEFKNQIKSFLNYLWYDYVDKEFEGKTHEAIRPTDISKSADDYGLTWLHKKIYEFIRKYTLSVFMKDARYKKYICYYWDEYIFKWEWIYLVEPWWLIIWWKQKEDVNYYEEIEINNIIEEEYPKVLKRYTEASLIDELKKKWIWRPSTYVNIISTLYSRGYVYKKRWYLIPNENSFKLIDFAIENFSEIFSYDFTAKMENYLDKISNWEIKYKEFIESFYTKLKEYINAAFYTKGY